VFPSELACHGTLVAFHLSVCPGLTGRWQCNGRCTARYPERAELVAAYVATGHCVRTS